MYCVLESAMLSVIEASALSRVRRRSPDNDGTACRLADEAEQDFAFRRQKNVEAGLGKPLVRLAAFLVAVSRRNALEGRDPYLVDDTLNCAVIAEYLGVRLDVLARALLQLEARGLVRPALDHGLRLIDVAALDSVTCDEASAPC
jgi:CRP/FNR family transcriptional regulator